jgi:hypothetical protein
MVSEDGCQKCERLAKKRGVVGYLRVKYLNSQDYMNVLVMH